MIFASSETGETFIFRANPAKFEEIAVNQLGNEAMASPAICGGRIYLHVAEEVDGQRQGMLYCLAKQK